MSAVEDVVVLDDGAARVEIRPAWGGGVIGYGVRLGGRFEPVFRPDPSRKGMFALGCNVLLPFSNRISGGGFRHDGEFYPLAPNIDGNPLPTHGNAFQQAWHMEACSAHAATLSLNSAGPGPFRYAAKLEYRLDGGSLVISMRVTNTGAAGLPFGAGFHPWFVRDPLTRLQLVAAGYWTEDAAHLPKAFVRTVGGDFDFGAVRPLPEGWTNLTYTGWDGQARIEWPARNLSVDIEAAAPLTTAIVYSPSTDADFFCFEPVSHSVDAHNRSGEGTAPPQVLQPGDVMTVAMAIHPRPLREV